MALQARGESLSGQAVRWVTDSQSAVTILKVGSMKPRCHAVAVAGLGFWYMCTTSHSPVSGCRLLPQRSWLLMT